MKRKKPEPTSSNAKTVPIALRAPAEWVQQVDALVDQQNQGKAFRLTTRSRVFQECLQLGWEIYRKRFEDG